MKPTTEVSTEAQNETPQRTQWKWMKEGRKRMNETNKTEMNCVKQSKHAVCSLWTTGYSYVRGAARQWTDLTMDKYHTQPLAIVGGVGL